MHCETSRTRDLIKAACIAIAEDDLERVRAVAITAAKQLSARELKKFETAVDQYQQQRHAIEIRGGIEKVKQYNQEPA